MNTYRVIGYESGVYLPQKETIFGWKCISWCLFSRRYYITPWFSFVWTRKTPNWHSKAEYAWDTIRTYDTSKHKSIGTLSYNQCTNDTYPIDEATP